MSIFAVHSVTTTIVAYGNNVDGKTSNLLTVMPIARHHFYLSAVEFCDALAIRYEWPLMRMPATCDDYSALFSLVHALDCKGALFLSCFIIIL